MVPVKKSIWILAASLLPLLADAPANAFTMAQRCVIAHQDCLVIRVAAGGMSAESRLDRVNDRLAYVLGYEPLRPSAIRAVQTEAGVEIRVGASHLVTVTPADASANDSRNVMGLARVWLRNLRAALPEARPMAQLVARRTAPRLAKAY